MTSYCDPALSELQKAKSVLVAGSVPSADLVAAIQKTKADHPPEIKAFANLREAIPLLWRRKRDVVILDASGGYTLAKLLGFLVESKCHLIYQNGHFHPVTIGEALSRLGDLPFFVGPLAWYERRWRERYYERYLKDKHLADDFRRRYLPTQFQNREGLVLDLGCGRGRVAAMLSQCGFQVVGLDRERHDFWASIPNCTFVLGDVQALPFRDSLFDLCTHISVLQYVPDDETHVGEIARVLKAAGELAIHVPNEDNLKTLLTGRQVDPTPSFRRAYTKRALTQLLESTGFKVDKVEMEGFYSPLFTTAINYLLNIACPGWVMQLVSRLTPPQYRGIITAIASKKGVGQNVAP